MHGLDKLLESHLCVITSCSHCKKTAFEFFSAKYQPSQLLSARTLRFNLVHAYYAFIQNMLANLFQDCSKRTLDYVHRLDYNTSNKFCILKNA